MGLFESASRDYAHRLHNGHDPDDAERDLRNQKTGTFVGGSWEVLAAAGVVVAVVEAWRFVSDQKQAFQNTLHNFYQQLQMGTAIFELPKDVIPTRYSREQQAVKSFIDTIRNGNQTCFSYTGIELSEPDTRNIYLYTVLPFYKMNNKHPVGRTEEIESSVVLFLDSEVERLLKNIELDFYKKTKSTFSSLWDWVIHIFTGDKVFDRKRVKRLIIISLANLLWNLLLPCDPKTRIEYSIDEKILITVQAGRIINDLLNRNVWTYVEESQTVKSFMVSLELHVKSLGDHYEKQKKSSFELADVISHSETCVTDMVDMSFFLAFGDMNHKRPKDICQIFNEVSLAMSCDNDNDIKSIFQPYIESVPDDYKRFINTGNDDINVVDVFLIFSLIEHSKKEKIIQQLNELRNHKPGCLAVVTKLKQYRSLFLRPIRKNFSRDRKEVARKKSIKYFFPIAVLAIFCHNRNLCTQGTESQFNEILQVALAEDDDEQELLFSLSALIIDKQDIIGEEIIKLQKKHYEVSRANHLLELINAYVSRYRDSLTDPNFKRFIVHTLKNTNKKFDELNQILIQIGKVIANKSIATRGLDGMIQQVKEKIEAEIAKIDVAISTLNKKIKDPDFDKKIRDEQIGYVGKIQLAFKNAFGCEDNNIQIFMERIAGDSGRHFAISTQKSLPLELEAGASPEPSPESSPKTSRAQSDFFRSYSNRCITTKTNMNDKRHDQIILLVDACIKHLSSWHAKGKKGQALEDLLTQLRSDKPLEDAELRAIVTRLSVIVCAYRPTTTGFFQADYAQTKSAKYLIAQIRQNLRDEQALPLAQWLFSDGEVETLQRLRRPEDKEEYIVSLLRNQQILQPSLRPLNAQALEVVGQPSLYEVVPL